MITVKGINDFTGYISPVTFYRLGGMLSSLVISSKNGDHIHTTHNLPLFAKLYLYTMQLKNYTKALF